MKFRAHETFSIRKGWLSKGMKYVAECPNVFSRKDPNPMDVLGLGSNMVKSLRYWLPAVGLTEAVNRGQQQLTELGEIVMSKDPYIEEIGTLWLLHYHLVTGVESSTSWYWFFNCFGISEFSRDDFVEGLENFARMNGEEVPSRSLEDDFNCIIATYMPRYKSAPGKVDPESNMDCPLSELGLIDYQNKAKKVYKQVIPSFEMIPPQIASAIIAAQAEGRKEIPIAELQNAIGGLGKVCHLDTMTLLSVLSAAERAGYIRIVRTAGLDVVELADNLSFMQCVCDYYDEIEDTVGDTETV